MARINLFGLGVVSKSPYVTANKMTNIYCEQRPQGEKSMLVAYGTPGLLNFVNFGATPARGGLEFPKNDVDYVVHRGVLWEVNAAGVATNRGTLLTTSGRVSMSHNGVQVMIVDGTTGYIYDTDSTVFAEITDGEFFDNPTTVTYLGNRFICSFAGSNRFQWSDIDDGLSWDALNFASAGTNPDPIVAVYASNGQLILFGSESTEFWGLSGVADPAFTLIQGTASEWGLAAVNSIAKYDNTFICVMKSRQGPEVIIAKMNGYIPGPISNVDIGSIINRYPAVSDATAYSYMLGMHPMYVVSFPSAGYTWLYDGSTNMWSPLKSTGLTRHLGEFSFNLINNTIVADYSTGALYKLKPDVLTDNGAAIPREIVGETVASPNDEFIPVDCLRLDMETGVGLTSGQGENPQIALSISRDNGNTWGPEMWRTFGKIGEYGTRVEWRQLGTSRYFTPKILFTDPVPAVFVSACLNPEN